MPADENGGGGKLTHPGSWIGDSIEEFKKLPTWGKIAVGVVIVGVIAFAIHARNQAAKNAGSSPQQAMGAAASSPGLGIPSGASDGGGSSPAPIAPSPTPSPTPTAGSPYQYVNGVLNSNLIALLPQGTKLPTSGNYTYQGVTYQVNPGGGGRVWGKNLTNPGAGSVLLTGPAQYYPGGTGSGPGSDNMFAMMGDPGIYLGSAEPHISSAHPQ